MKLLIYHNLLNIILSIAFVYNVALDFISLCVWRQVRGGSFYWLPPRVAEGPVKDLDDPACGGVSGSAALLPAIDLDREHEGGDPDGHDRDVDQYGERAADAHGLQERLH